MKTEEFLNCLGEIDEHIISEADKPILEVKNKYSWIKWPSVAASFAAIIAIGLFLNSYLPTQKSNPIVSSQNKSGIVLSKTFSSINEIPVTKIGNNYLTGCNDQGPSELFTANGKFYFTMVTRWVGNEKTKETVNSYTLFRFNPENGSSTSVSDEVGYIQYVKNQFIYDRSGLNLNADNRYSVQYYSNNADWNDEKKIDSNTVKKLNNYKNGAGIAEQVDNKIKIKMNDSSKEYVVIPDYPDIVTFDIIGILADKLFISGYSKDNQNALYSIDLKDSKLTKIMIGDTAVSGICSYIGEDNYIYANNRNLTSTLIKVDPTTNNAEAICEAKAFVWDYVVSDKYIVCTVAGKSGADPTSIIAIKR